MVDTYYRVPGAAGINSDIKDMALYLEAQMGEMPDVVDGKVLDTIHALMSSRRASAGGCASSSNASAPPGTAMAGEAMIMPATGSSAIAAESAATAR